MSVRPNDTEIIKKSGINYFEFDSLKWAYGALLCLLLRCAGLCLNYMFFQIAYIPSSDFLN